MGFWDTLDALFVLDEQTDHRAPGSKILMDRLRQAFESLARLVLSTGVSGTATSDPPNDTTGEFEDTGAGFADDEHNGRTLLITDGAAKGNKYTIDDTIAASDAVYCTGDNLYSDGVRSGDAYEIMYDMKVNADGHDHDGVNSKDVVLADGKVAGPYCLGDSETALSMTGEGYSVVESFPIYIPNGATILNMRAKTYTTDGGYNVNIKFTINSQDSSVFGHSNVSPGTWGTCTLDCSGITPGWYQCDISIDSAAATSGYATQLSFAWTAS